MIAVVTHSGGDGGFPGRRCTAEARCPRLGDLGGSRGQGPAMHSVFMVIL